MSLYQLHLKWKGKDITVKARNLDMTHPYFVSIKNLVFTKESPILINPAENEIKKEFEKSKNLMFPFQSILLIEEIEDNQNFIVEKKKSI